MRRMGADVFPSKVDGWLAAVIVIAALTVLGTAGATLVTDAPGRLLVTAALVALGAFLPLWVLFGTRYLFAHGELRIFSGPFRWKVPLADIRAVRRTRNPLSSPALSLDRLRIDYGRGKWIMVSPRDHQAFLAALRAHGARIDQVATPNR